MVVHNLVIFVRSVDGNKNYRKCTINSKFVENIRFNAVVDPLEKFKYIQFWGKNGFNAIICDISTSVSITFDLFSMIRAAAKQTFIHLNFKQKRNLNCIYPFLTISVKNFDTKRMAFNVF